MDSTILSNLVRNAPEGMRQPLRDLIREIENLQTDLDAAKSQIEALSRR